ncbi:GGDEF domain-containing protein [Paenibacillus filicis]|uniref:GGDEF domain-containing protein n=1 Tax=Paenibacillus gyeongsangnamensis TaxID=3388067 RepID=A0ABT4QIR2_9BACL|nr:GGDEF domain-containing protein [Paenibacillus filicis]MCZ8516734.1 GGDEF domain-containing protein [Paenibacillus filicis]
MRNGQHWMNKQMISHSKEPQLNDLRRAYSLRILVTVLVLVFMLLIVMVDMAAVYTVDFLVDRKDLLKQMILFEIPVFILAPFLTSTLVNKVALPLRGLSCYIKQLSGGDIQSPVPVFVTPNHEVNELDQCVIHAVEYVKTRFGDLKVEAETDPLTGLVNRRTLDRIIEHWGSNHSAFSLIMLDIDYFKRINDTYGHGVGDEVLRYLSTIMLGLSRTGDYCCRYGGEEFVILLPWTSMDKAISVAERLRIKMSETVSPVGEIITISLGVATWETSDQDVSDILLRADQALYAAKQTGRNRVVAG